MSGAGSMESILDCHEWVVIKAKTFGEGVHLKSDVDGAGIVGSGLSYEDASQLADKLNVEDTNGFSFMACFPEKKAKEMICDGR